MPETTSNRFSGPLQKIDECRWRIPRSYKQGMRVDGIIFANDDQIEQIRGDQAPEQVANVAFLPGIQSASLAMPDIHWGYGFCIGGVCATAANEGGGISPGGVGYDINCGVRLLRSRLMLDDFDQREQVRLVNALFQNIPTGTGRTGRYSFTDDQLDAIMTDGPRWLVKNKGAGVENDIYHTEGEGRLEAAQPHKVSRRAHERGQQQCGTLGSGNHFLEVQIIDRIFDEEAARVLGLKVGQVCVLIHSGSRGLGYQVCEDTLRIFRKIPQQLGIALPDRQLACAPIDSREGADYIGAMRAAANFAWANRHLLMVETRKVFESLFDTSWQDLGMELVYDVAHNIAKEETHQVNGGPKKVWVHRKGATRSFPPGHEEVPADYRQIGQPVFIPGSMGTFSWIMVGRPGAMEKSFGTTCHGAGRAMSRRGAKRVAAGRDIASELQQRGIVVRARGKHELAEEQPDAYKDVNQVVEAVSQAGLTAKVARLRAFAVIKG